MIDRNDIAAARRALGRQLARYRQAAGLNQHQFAPRTHYGRSTIANVEVGRQNVPRDFWCHCDDLLEAGGALLRGYDQLQALIARQRRETLQLEAQQAAVTFSPFAGPYANGYHDDDTGLAAVRSFRAADSQVGGGHLYATVVQYLQTEIAPRLFGSASTDSGIGPFTSAAALTEMAGWMAHDAGRDPIAAQHFSRALDLVRIRGDVQLSAHILGSLSHLAHQQGQPVEAIRLARAGRQTLGRDYRRSQLASRLLALEARGYAAERDVDRCTTLLRQAEGVLGKSTTDALSPWVSQFDEGSLANEAAHCFLALGHFAAAQRQAEMILSIRPPARARSRALGQLMLARVLVAKNQPEAACAAVDDVLAGTSSLSSYLVSQQLAGVGRSLAPFAASSVVARCLDQLREVVRARQAFTLWIAAQERDA